MGTPKFYTLQDEAFYQGFESDTDEQPSPPTPPIKSWQPMRATERKKLRARITAENFNQIAAR